MLIKEKSVQYDIRWCADTEFVLKEARTAYVDKTISTVWKAMLVIPKYETIDKYQYLTGSRNIVCQ